MPGTQGNQNAVKLVTEELKKEAYKSYCEHVAAGKSKDSWYFKDTERLLCTYKCMESYMKEDPVVFPPIHMQLAKCKSKEVWEEKGVQMMDGKRHSEPALYQMFMRNKFDWDKPEKSQSAEDSKVELKNYSEALKKQRAQPVVQEEDRID